MRKFAFSLFSFLLVLLWPILLVSTTLSCLASQTGFYTAGWARHDVAVAAGIQQSELDRLAREFVEYFNSGQEYLDIKISRGGQAVDLFSRREIEHMKDVKGLVGFGYTVQWVSLVYVTVFTSVGLFWWKGKRRRTIYKLAIAGCLATLLAMVGIAGMVLFNFESFFLGFHLLSFSNDFWQLDPAQDYLIRLFPEGFFFDAALFIGGCVALEATGIGALAWWLLKRGRSLESGVQSLESDYWLLTADC